MPRSLLADCSVMNSLKISTAWINLGFFLVHVLNQISQPFPFECTDVGLDVVIQSWQFRRGCISFMEVIIYNISTGMCRPVGMWGDIALSRTVRKIISCLWQSVGRELLLRATSTSCLYLNFRLT